MTTIVACVWVQGHVKYDAEYVIRLERMARAWLSRPFEFVCLTDRPDRLPTITTEKIPNPRPQYAWWSKLHLFNPSTFTRGARVLYLDLDTLVVGSLDAIVDYPAPFALIPDAGTFKGIGKRGVVKRFNSSVMTFDAGSLPLLWEAWTPGVTERLWGDQDLIGELCPEAARMPAEWFPRISQITSDGPSTDARVILCKVPKNHVAAKRWGWVRQAWGAA